MKIRVLLISKEKIIIEAITREIGPDIDLLTARSLNKGLQVFEAQKTAVVLIDAAISGLPDRSAFKKLFSDFWEINPMARFIILTTKGNIQIAIKAVEAGASSYLLCPAGFAQMNKAVASVLRHMDSSQQAKHFITQDSQSGFLEMLKTRSETMKRVFEKIALVSQTETTVLLTGETGVGKGIIARLIHEKSGRSAGPMLNVHCGAIPESLIESELFGHEKGSFTGAIRNKKGKFEQASRGTIFLDEIGTVTAATQIKMLQVLQDKTFQPVGSEKTFSTDVRVIAASNSDLEQMVDRGEFRKDLYFRLNIFPIEIPALRLRKKDLPLFITFFIDQLNSKHEKQIKGVTPEVMEAFDNYAWPGNIRELENLLQRAFILGDKPFLGVSVFPADLFTGSKTNMPSPSTYLGTLAEIRQKAVAKAETEYLCAVLKAHSGKINQASMTAGISRRQLHKLLSKHGIRKVDFKS
ncbi:MAG: sigma-54 dependent transcriptional regulator [Proteobacteria bacterium]|nr:sigma-54 dependent transcriptional regulator [Pseudomonadota bacterium]MBU1696922.1 sigma-54 dependent transcriptional regulator [Pseudomonadota bacterium]